MNNPIRDGHEAAQAALLLLLEALFLEMPGISRTPGEILAQGTQPARRAPAVVFDIFDVATTVPRTTRPAASSASVA